MPYAPNPLSAAVSDPKVVARFWLFVVRTHPFDCWIWTGANTKGYGTFSLEGRSVYAHRVSFTIANGAIGAGLYIMHTCDEPSCVNPAHLRQGTHSQNMADMIAKGRLKICRGEENGSSKLTQDSVDALRAAYRAGGVTQRALAVKYGVTQALISLIVRGEAWSASYNQED